MKKRIPWGVLAWVCAEVAFFLTLAIVAAFVVLNGIAGATSGGITLFTNWWQTILFVVDLIVVGGLVFCAYKYFSSKKKKDEEVKTNES